MIGTSSTISTKGRSEEKSVLDFLEGKTANQRKNELKAVRGFIRFAISERATVDTQVNCAPSPQMRKVVLHR
jgi:hypothetical protein